MNFKILDDIKLCIFIGKFLILETFYIPAQANQAGQDFMGGPAPIAQRWLWPRIYLFYLI